MNGFDKKKDFKVLQAEFGFKPLTALWTNTFIIYAKRISGDIYAYLQIKSTKYDSNITLIKLYVARIQDVYDGIKKDPTSISIDICFTEDLDFKRENVNKLTAYAEEKIITVIPSLMNIANNIDEFNKNFKYPELGRYDFLEYEYNILKTFLLNIDLFKEVSERISECIKKGTKLNAAKKKLMQADNIQKLKNIMPPKSVNYDYFKNSISIELLVDALINRVYQYALLNN